MRVDPTTLCLCALSLALCHAGCATVTVGSGHGAVLTTADGAMTVLPEGAFAVPLSSTVDDFDLTQQEEGKSLGAITADGVAVVVGDPIVSYRLVAGELLAAEREVGPAYAKTLIAPLVHSAIAAVLSAYRYDQLDTPHLREAQARITALGAARLRPYHVELSSVELKGVSPRLPELTSAVTDTSVWEQRSVEARTHLDVVRRGADGLREQAQGLAAAYRSVAPTLSAAVIADKQEKAWQQLITSPSTEVKVSDGALSTMEVLP